MITQGNWKIFYDGEIHTDDKMICCGLGFDSFKEFIDRKEQQANARMIAAAPELFRFAMSEKEKGNKSAINLIKTLQGE